ncbi:hypothetical protein C436_21215 [Haloarcula marismortui ATCC 33800]|uniref:Uncharacterized protein n=1 Tax=Haloarcula marismortui ATCC 33800 TaxID=662476 RepID=M0JHE9_9EURY|nr:hypothetical protein C436_21215 [Haloarcula sinaiiensis ATCC 33800]
MEFASEIEAVSLQCCFEPVHIINEKDGVVNVVFLAELSKEDLGQSGCIRRKRTDIEVFVGVRIDGGVQPVLVIVDANHTLMQQLDSELHRRLAANRLFIPNSGLPFGNVDTQINKNRNCIRKQQSCRVNLNTVLHRSLGCPFVLDKIQINLLSTTADACDFGMDSRNHLRLTFDAQLTTVV